MKKKIILLLSILILTLPFLGIASDNSIKSILDIPFGESCTIKAEFIDKPNTYYAQNISHSEFYLKIIEINNKKLSNPLIVEPVYGNIKIEKNKIYILKAYEIIYSEGKPKDWIDSEIAEQFNYSIRRKIAIKNP